MSFWFLFFLFNNLNDTKNPNKDLFEVVYGVNLELNKLEQSSHGINFVSRTSTNNGVSAKVNIIREVKPQPPGTISVSGGGSPCEAFVQLENYYSGRDLYVLYPKENFSTEVLTFYCTCIRMNKYRFNLMLLIIIIYFKNKLSKINLFN